MLSLHCWLKRFEQRLEAHRAAGTSRDLSAERSAGVFSLGANQAGSQWRRFG